MPTVKRKDRGPAVVSVLRDLTLAAWARSPFGSRDRDLEDADGELVGGIRLHLGPDGRLYGVIEEPRDE